MDQPTPEPMNRRNFFRRGLKQIIQPLTEMADQLQHPLVRPKTRSVARKSTGIQAAQGRISRSAINPTHAPNSAQTPSATLPTSNIHPAENQTPTGAILNNEKPSSDNTLP
ncbi:MAG: hypothetical protein IT448_04425 [Phycisphaerales bacterium]|nr:hypothetical protein [Phycisphaerales bacterium]